MDTKRMELLNLFILTCILWGLPVKGQSLKVAPDPAVGAVGESVNITWTITKRYQNDKVADTRLYLGTVFTKSNLLYQGVAKLSKLNPAEAMFGDRIQAIFKELKYVLTINSLSYNDTIMFTLVVNQEIGATLIGRSVANKSVQVIVKVKEQLLNVTHDQVIGVVGQSVKITWTITKRYQNDKVADTRLYLGTVFTKSNLLYQGVAKLSKLNPAKAIFGHRLQAIFKEPKYVLTINSLSYNDTIMFTLVVNQEIGTTLIPRSVSKKSVQIIVTGGPEFCLGNLSRNYTMDDNSLPKINIVLCGLPQPAVEAEFVGQKLKVLNTTVNSYTYNYILELPWLTQLACGKELIVTTTGYNGTLTDKINIYASNCRDGIPAETDVEGSGNDYNQANSTNRN